jgi:N-acetylmuramoyl-L-alanine amidase
MISNLYKKLLIWDNVSKSLSLLTLLVLFAACSRNPYAETNRVYKKQVKGMTDMLKESPLGLEQTAYPVGDYWVGATNFNLRKPNFVILHHTAQNSTAQTLKTFTTPATEVSAHYVVGRDGKVYQMLNDYMRAWHAGVAKWGNNTDINSSSIGIELDNNGNEPFTDEQMNSLLALLKELKDKYSIPTANFIGHADIAPTRKNDPSPAFPWKKLADQGYGLWYDEDVLDSVMVAKTYASTDTAALLDKILQFEKVPKYAEVPDSFSPKEALRIIGYDVQNLEAAIRSFKLHFTKNNGSSILSAADKRILYNLYKKYL